MFQTTNQYIYIYIAQAKEGIYPRTTIEHFPGPQSLQLVVPSPTIAIRSQPNFAAVLHEDLLCFVVRDIDIGENMGKYAYTHIIISYIYIYYKGHTVQLVFSFHDPLTIYPGNGEWESPSFHGKTQDTYLKRDHVLMTSFTLATQTKQNIPVIPETLALIYMIKMRVMR